jgi:exosortase A-associated hydrolase 1/exosortase A-associated hydrolase 2
VLDSASGPLVCVYHAPEPHVPSRGGVLLAPAFAEEMNRCRSMVTLQAQQFASMGLGTLVVDLWGTGDSAGEFNLASWDGWADDLCCGADWLRAHAQGCVTLWGVRLGALMAAELAARLPDVQRLLLWQPVVSGKTYWTQFLRIRIAAEMSEVGGVKTTEELRQRSLRGEAVEVSGYEVGATLAKRLDQLGLPDATALAGKQIDWCEVLTGPDAAVARVSAKAVEALVAGGVPTNLVSVTGPAFWQVHERDVAPELIRATTRLAESWPVMLARAPKLPVPIADDDRAESPIVFDCAGATLVGVLHRGAAAAEVGVVIVVAGGPQYRVGAHRQFVALARVLAAQGYPVLRFDLRGMGDSTGTFVGYQESGPDIRAAVDQLQTQVPTLHRVMLFGECEAASAILFYAWQDTRVHKIALVNPWIRTEEGRAEVILKHYYRDRFLSRRFWADLASGKVKAGRALASFADLLKTYLKGRKNLRAGVERSADDDLEGLPLVAKTAEGLRRFPGSVLLLMSGRDYIAREFDEVTRSSQAWAALQESPRVKRVDIEGADHTFSRAEWKAAAHDALRRWLGSESANA